jgi:hypothetical protein
MAGIFPFWRIALDAGVAFAASFVLLVALRKQFKVSLVEAAIMAGTLRVDLALVCQYAHVKQRSCPTHQPE